jgi:Zn-dependent membrane protease YugP
VGGDHAVEEQLDDKRLEEGDEPRTSLIAAALFRMHVIFRESTDPAEFDFSERDLDMLRERMLKRAKRSR